MFHKLTRRRMLLTIGGGATLASALRRAASQTPELPEIRAYRNPGCGCCEKWADHLRAAGFKVNMSEDHNLAGRRRSLGVPEAMSGCHLAQAGSYIIEGHVPAADIIKLLKSRPAAAGLSVPGMPMGSPGMESDSGSESYDVLIFQADGRSEVYSRY
jgi:hypothetical protein